MSEFSSSFQNLLPANWLNYLDAGLLTFAVPVLTVALHAAT
jgi:hypothetical protein